MPTDEDWLALRRRLESFRALKPGWDSYDAKPVTEEAFTLAALLLRAPEIMPTPAGGIQLEWREFKTDGLYVEIEVLPDGMLEVLLMRGDQPIKEWSEDALEPIREAAERWKTLMAEAAEHLKEPEHLERMARVQRAIEEDAEELRLLRDVEVTRTILQEWKGTGKDLRKASRDHDDAWDLLAAFRARQKETHP